MLMGFLLLRASEEGPVMHYMHSNSFQCFEWCNITHYLHMLQKYSNNNLQQVTCNTKYRLVRFNWKHIKKYGFS